MSKNPQAIKIGRLLKKFRGEAGLTQEQLKNLCVTLIQAREEELDQNKKSDDDKNPDTIIKEKFFGKNTISDIERGVHLPRATTRALIADALELSSTQREALFAIEDFAYQGVNLQLAPNLPTFPEAFIGRDHDLREIIDILSDPDKGPLLSLIGPGGVGKSRLAAKIGEETQSIFDGGVRWVSLAPIDTSRVTEVIPAIARVLEVPDRAPITLEAALRDLLVSNRILLILDSFEHVIDAANDLAPIVGTESPRRWPSRILVTSRSPLNISGEVVHSVLPLPTPDPNASAEDIRASPSVQLFIRRLPAPEASLFEGAGDDERLSLVAKVCAAVDGLPLALELAANNFRDYGHPEALLNALTDPDRLLSVEGPRDLPERQRTLDKVISWSYNAIATDYAKDLFCALSVFRGGWTEEAATAVSPFPATSIAIHDDLAALADQNLIRSPDTTGRYRMLQTIRSFAEKQLVDADGLETTQERHAIYFANQADGVISSSPPVPSELSSLIEDDHANFITAIEWDLVRNPKNPDIALRICAAMWPIWWSGRGYVSKGREYLERVTNGNHESSEPLVRVWLGHARLAERQRAFTIANDSATKCLDFANALQPGPIRTQLEIAARLALSRALIGNDLIADATAAAMHAHQQATALGDQVTIGRALRLLGDIANRSGNAGEAVEHYSQALGFLRVREDNGELAVLLNTAGELAAQGGHIAKAREHLREAQEIAQSTRHTWLLARVLSNLGMLANETDPAGAASSYLEALNVARMDSNSDGQIRALNGLAVAAARQGRLDVSARMFAAAEMTAKAEVDAPAIDESVTDHVREAVRTLLGEERWRVARAKGESLAPWQLAAEARVIAKVASRQRQPTM